MASFLLLQLPESFRVLLSCRNNCFCYLNLTGITKFKYERKNEMNSGLSSKKTSLGCKRPSLFILSKRDDDLIVMQNVQRELHPVSRNYRLL